MSKSPDAFRTISEVAEWLGTPAHVLRFWESRFAQVKPVKRAGGRRYYRPNDMLLLGGIKKLLHEDGMTIKGAQKMLRTEGVKKVSLLSKQLEDTGDVALDEAPAPLPPPTLQAPEPEPWAVDPEPEFNLETDTAPVAEPKSPVPLTADTPADPGDDADFPAPANIAALLRGASPDALNNPDTIALLSRLQSLHGRIKSAIDAAAQA